MLKPKLNTLMLWIFVLSMLAMSTKTEMKYTPYQITVFAIRGFEDFSPYWYKDGKTEKGEQKFSIGYGYNDWGLYSRRAGINPPITHEKALQLTLAHLATLNSQSSDKWTALAFKLRAYNTGCVRSIEQLKGCCGSTNGCGDSRKYIRDSHTPRRKFEYALATHNFAYVNDVVAELQLKNLQILQKGGK